jgi:hypothetical protein
MAARPQYFDCNTDANLRERERERERDEMEINMREKI